MNEGPTVIVTGASAGIGAATAARFAREGARVVLVGRRAERLEALAAELGGNATTVVLDVRDRTAVYREMAAIVERVGTVDVLVNNAGLALGLEPAQTANPDDWDTVIDTNVKGLVHVTRAVLPSMVAASKGHIINIGSVAGSYPYPGGHVYGASKAFVEQFSLNLRADLLGTNVRVTNVEPGMVETEFSVVRTGDEAKAKSVYRGMTPMTGADIADIIHFCFTRPPHLNVNRIEVMATAQAFGPFAVHRA